MAQSGPPPVPNRPASKPPAPPPSGDPHARYNSAQARYERAVQEVDRAVQEHGEKVEKLFKDEDGVPYYERRKDPFADPNTPQRIREADEARWRADAAFAEYDEATTELNTAKDALPPLPPPEGGNSQSQGGGSTPQAGSPTPSVPGPQSGKTYPGIGQPGVGTGAQSGNTIQGVQPTPPIQVVPRGESKQGLNPFGATHAAPCPPYCGGPSGSGTQKQVLGVNGTRAVVQNSNRR